MPTAANFLTEPEERPPDRFMLSVDGQSAPHLDGRVSDGEVVGSLRFQARQSSGCLAPGRPPLFPAVAMTGTCDGSCQSTERRILLAMPRHSSDMTADGNLAAPDP